MPNNLHHELKEEHGKQVLIEELMVRYSEALSQIGFSTRGILRMLTQGVTAKKPD